MIRRRNAFLVLAALALAACGDGDTMGDAGMGTQGSNSVVTVCGDGRVDGAEQCDDGNTQGGDGCSNSCTRESGSGATPSANDATSSGDGSDAGAGGGAQGGQDAAMPAMDASAGGQQDAAPGGDAAPPAQDASDGSDAVAEAGGPALAEPLCPAEPPGPCEACNCSMCKTELDECSNLAGVAAEGPAMGTSKAALCEALVRCGRTTGCRSIGCVCEQANVSTCLTGTTPPDGPCRNEVLAAAETTDMATFVTRASVKDMGYAVAVASAVSTCAASACASACMQ